MNVDFQATKTHILDPTARHAPKKRHRTDRSTRGSWEPCQNRPATYRDVYHGYIYIYILSIHSDKWTLLLLYISLSISYLNVVTVYIYIVINGQ